MKTTATVMLFGEYTSDEDDVTVKVCDNESDKPVDWSRRGTQAVDVRIVRDGKALVLGLSFPEAKALWVELGQLLGEA
jgi:hypothetical protein